LTEPPPRYEIEVQRAARRALAETLPLLVATAVVEFIAADLSTAPHRVGKELNDPLAGIHSARVLREWRLLYTIDDEARVVSVLAVRHRSDAYRGRP